MTIRSIYRLILSKLNPLKYAQKSGVNMRGGGTSIRKSCMGYRTMDYYTWKQCAHH
jgi:hypothetical protein